MLAPFNNNGSKAESIHASEVSTVLDTSKEEVKTSGDNADEDEGWIHGASDISQLGKGTRKLPQHRKDVRKELEGKTMLHRQDTPQAGGGQEAVPQVSRRLLEHLNRYELYKGEDENINEDRIELQQCEEQSKTVFVKSIKEQIEQKIAELTRSIKEKQGRINRFRLYSYICCDNCDTWYRFDKDLVCDEKEFRDAKWSCGCKEAKTREGERRWRGRWRKKTMRRRMTTRSSRSLSGGLRLIPRI